MAIINVNARNVIGRIKPLHGVNQPPIIGGCDTSKFTYLTQAGMPYSRLHDVGGHYGGNRFVDIPNIFRDFDADECDPASYDFAFTDVLMKGLVDAGVEPYYRLGITIESSSHIKAYRTAPPKDYEKWARICEHIIMHYNYGWANGFHYNVKYWEIWNEPESEEEYHGSTMMWDGTPIQFFRLYETASKYLKKRFPEIKIGGYGSAGFSGLDYIAKRGGNTDGIDRSTFEFWAVLWVKYVDKFFSYIKEHDCPIDFFSFHSYGKTESNIKYDEYAKSVIEKYGYGDIELHLNEWNPVHKERGTAHHSAEIISTMIALQNGRTDKCMFYDMRICYSPTYAGLFNIETLKPLKGYYSFVAFNELYKLENQIETVCDTANLYVLGASGKDGTSLIVCNMSDKKQTLNISGLNLDNAEYYIISQDKDLEKTFKTDALNQYETLLIKTN